MISVGKYPTRKKSDGKYKKKKNPSQKKNQYIF